MDPQVWGRHLWISIHYIALGYPLKPSEIDRKNYSLFFKHLHTVLPCDACAKHYQQHLKDLPPIEQFLESPEELFKWTVLIHNKVNLDLGKPQLSYEQARKLYPSQMTKSFLGNGPCSTSIAMGVLVAVLVVLAGGGAFFLMKLKPKN
jgi:hypothetical protein